MKTEANWNQAKMDVDVHEAKAHLSKLLDRVAAGEEIMITRHGRPVALIVCVGGPSGPRKLGSLNGRIHISDEFDSPLPLKILRRIMGSSRQRSGKRGACGRS